MKKTIFMQIIGLFLNVNMFKLGFAADGAWGATAAKMNKAFDGTTMSSKLVELNEEQAEEFITFLKDESVLLKKTRFVKMKKSTKTIAKLFVNGRFLYPGSHGAVDRTKDTSFGGGTLELNSKLLRGQFLVTDQEMEDNIEGGKINDKFIRLIASKVGNELEEIATYSRKRDDAASALELFNGFKYQAIKTWSGAHVVNAADTGVFTDRLVEKKKFTKAIKSVPTSFRQSLQAVVSSGTVIDYQDQYDTVADSGVRNDLRGKMAGKPYIEAPLMREDEPVLVSGGAATTLSTGATAGTAFTVASPTGIATGTLLVTDFGTEKEQRHTVDSVAGSVVTVVEAFAYDIDNGATVKEVTRDGTDALMTDPRNLIYAIQTNEDLSFEIERIASVGYVYHFKMRADVAVENTDALCIISNMKIA